MKFIEQLAAKNHTSISNVTVTLQDPGPLTAVVTPAATPGGGQTLSLEFVISGNELTFDHPALVNWADDFDIAVSLTTPVPVLPFGFAPSLTARGENAEVSPNNFLAKIAEGGDNWLTDIWSFITGGNFVSDVALDEEGLEIQTDTDLPTPNSPLIAMLTGMNSTGPDVVAAGFTQFAFSIENGNVLTGTLTHPLDPGPVVVDVTHPEAGGGVNFMLPELSASESVVPPGGPFTAAGPPFSSWTPRPSDHPPCSGRSKYDSSQSADTASASASSSVSFRPGCTIISTEPHDQYPSCRTESSINLYRATLFPA